MKIRTFKYYIKEAVQSMRRNGLMSLASISTVTLSLFILGVFACGVVNLNNLASHLENQVQISIYLKDNLTTPQVMELGKKLKALPELKDIEFVTKDEAMKRFKERLGEQQQLVDSLDGHNPLPTSYVLTFNTPDQVKSTAEIVSKYPEVESAHYGQDVIEQIFEVTKIIRIGGIVLIGFLAGATLFIISNTIRLTVFARRKEIGIMKYVGATNWFIRWPFVLEGMFLGAIGGAIAGIATWQFYRYITVEVIANFAFMPLVPMMPFIYQLSAGLVGIGVIVGAIGSTISLKQYMKV